jgi:hypothetical protein
MWLSARLKLYFYIFPTKRGKFGVELVLLLMALPSQHSIDHHSSSPVFPGHLSKHLPGSSAETLELPQRSSALSPRPQYEEHSWLERPDQTLKGTCRFQA